MGNKKYKATDSKSAPVANAGMPDDARIFRYQKIALFLIAFLVYANSFSNGFNIDDELYTTQLNPISNKGISAIGEIFTNHTFHDGGKDYEYRPVAMLTFLVQHQLGLDAPKMSHFINVLLYALTCLVLFLLLCKWFTPQRKWLAFFCCLLFAVHPLHTEIVNSIKSRDELLSLLLTTLSLFVIWKWHETKKLSQLIGGFFLLLLALLSKSTSTPLVLIVPIAFYFFGNMQLRKVMYVFLIGVLTYTVFWGLTNVMLPETVKDSFSYENPLYGGSVSLIVRFATVAYVMGWYLLLHFIPHPLVFFYGYAHVPLVDFSSWLVWLSILAHLALVALIIKELKKKSIFAFGGVFYFLNIMVFSNLLIPAPGIMAERFTYAASLGFCIMLCSLLFRIFKIDTATFSFNSKEGKYITGILVIACLAFSVKTISRNPDWESREILYGHDIEHLERSAKANMLYGEYMMSRVDEYRQQSAAASLVDMKKYYIDSARYYHTIAKKSLSTALEILPDYENAINNMAVVYFQEDSFSKAKYYLLKAQSINPAKAEIAYNIGVVYSREGKLDSALAQFQRTVNIDSSYLSAYKSMSDVYLTKNDTGNAIDILLLSAQNNAGKAAPYGELANISLMRRDTVQAIKYCEQAAESDPPSPPILSFLMNYYGQKGDQQKAVYYQNKMRDAQAAANATQE